jgi:peptidyl-tRNA hydrolase, PTH1 family
MSWTGRQCRSRTSRGRIGSEEVMVAQPETFMNLSGEAVACLLETTGATAGDLLVVCDDVAIDLGSIRVRGSGSDGGHRGLKSIAGSLGSEDFPRLRIGIRTAAAGHGDLADHVLASLGPAEWEEAQAQIRRAAECIQTVLEEGIRAAMNRYNRRQPRDPQPAG